MLKSDFKKYKKYSGKSSLILLITTQGLWAIVVYRIFNSIYKSKLPKILKKVFLLFGVILQKWIEIVTGISISYTSKIGHSFYIGHFGGIIINANAEIGNNCNISQGVTIGVSGRGKSRGVPVIKNNVYIGANAVIAGKVTIEDNCTIAANSLVVSSLEENSTVIGVPAKVINYKGSSEYL